MVAIGKAIEKNFSFIVMPPEAPFIHSLPLRRKVQVRQWRAVFYRRRLIFKVATRAASASFEV